MELSTGRNVADKLAQKRRSERSSLCPKPTNWIWYFLAVAYAWIAVLAILKASVYEPAALDVRWAVNVEYRRSAGLLSAVACSIQSVALFFAAAYSNAKQRPAVLAAALYCLLAVLTFSLDAYDLLWHPYELDLGKYGLASASGGVVFGILVAVAALRHGARAANKASSHPVVWVPAVWYLFWSLPHFPMKLWQHEAALPVSIVVSLITVGLFGVVGAAATVKTYKLLKLHWTVVVTGAVFYVAWLVSDALHLIICAGGHGVSADFAHGSVHSLIILETIQISVSVTKAIIAYEESSRFKAERDAAQAELAARIKHQQQAKEAEEARQKFLRYVFHEIRVPFNSLDMGLGMIMDDIEAADVNAGVERVEAPGSPEDRPIDVRLMEQEGYVGGMGTGLLLPDDARVTLDIMAKAAASMKVIINDTLDWTKLQSGAFQISLGATRLADVVRGTVVGLSAFAMHPDNKVKLVQEIDPCLPRWILSDKVRLQQVVANFLSNAVKFAPHDGTGVVTVKVHVLEGGLEEGAAHDGRNSRKQAAKRVPSFNPGSVWWKEAAQSLKDEEAGSSMLVSGKPSSAQVAVQKAVAIEPPVTALAGTPSPLHKVVPVAATPAPAAPIPIVPLGAQQRVPSFRISLTIAQTAGDTTTASPNPEHVPSAASAAQPPLVSPPALKTVGASVRPGWQAVAKSPVTALSQPPPAGRSHPANAAKAMPREVHGGLLPPLSPPDMLPEVVNKLFNEGFTPQLELQSPSGAFEAAFIPPEPVMQMCTLIISVKDNGEGIQAAEAPTLFRAFRQLDAGMQYKGKGTGLGLAICHEIVSLHGGRVGVRSSGNKGEGAEFVIALRLPILHKEGQSSHSSRKSRSTSRTPTGSACSSRSHSLESAEHGEVGTAHPTQHGTTSQAHTAGLVITASTGGNMSAASKSVGSPAGPEGAASPSLFAQGSGYLLPPAGKGQSSEPFTPRHMGSSARAHGVHEEMIRRATVAAQQVADAMADPESMPVPEALPGMHRMASAQHGSVDIPGSVLGSASPRRGLAIPRPPSLYASRGTSSVGSSIGTSRRGMPCMVAQGGRATGSASAGTVQLLPGAAPATADPSAAASAGDVTAGAHAASASEDVPRDEPSTKGRSHSVERSPASVSRAQRTGSGGSGSAVMPTLRILIVDDVGDSRRLLSKALKRRLQLLYTKACGGQLQVETEQAEDGHIAVEMVTGRPVESLPPTGLQLEGQPGAYDVITMDAEMPVLSGFTATRMVRAAGYAGLLFGCTGNALEEDQSLFRKCGANGVFIKPLDIAGLAKAILEGTGLVDAARDARDATVKL